VLPPAPQRTVQALNAPSTSNASGGSESEVFCLDGEITEESFDEATGQFRNVYDCAPGGGIDTITTEGQQDQNGDGAYVQTTLLESGSSFSWSFTFDTSEDFLVQNYSGVRDDGSESYTGVHALRDDGNWDVEETWAMREGTYNIAGIQTADGPVFDGQYIFDDPATEASPDWEMHIVLNRDGSRSQEVELSGEGFTSEYDFIQNADGSSRYDFSTDLTDSDVEPDFDGSYTYAADGSGEGDYIQSFDDGSLLSVHDVIHADGTVSETWTFDDAATGLAIDQEGEIHFGLDGSGEGTFTLHSEGGTSQTCTVRIDAEGVQTIEACQ